MKNYFKNISRCRICNNKILISIINLGDQPAANNLHKKTKKLIYVPLHLKICIRCKTAQLSSTINPKNLFSKYLWVTATSKMANEYAQIFYQTCKKIIKKNKFSVFEIACNDGTFLRKFYDNGCNVLGIDPAQNITKSIKDLRIINGFFNYEKSKLIKKEYNNFDFVFARNVIPHVPNILSVIAGFKNLMNQNSIGAIEFHYGKIIQQELHYDSIYHEHYFYFTIQTLSYLLKKFNLYIFDIKKSPISGGSLLIFFSRTKKSKSKKLIKYENLEKKDKINTVSNWVKFGKKSKKHAFDLNKVVKNEINKNNSLIHAYGASARSSTLLNFAKINNKHIKYIFDKNYLKKNLFTPGTDIKIKHFSNISYKLKTVLILSWNLQKEIIQDLKKRKIFKKAIIPLPRIKIIKL